MEVGAEPLSPAGQVAASGGGGAATGHKLSLCPAQASQRGKGGSRENESRPKGDPTAPLGNLQEMDRAPHSTDGRTGDDKGFPHSPEVKENLKLPQAHTFTVSADRYGNDCHSPPGPEGYWRVKSYVSKRCHCHFCLHVFPTQWKVSIRAIWTFYSRHSFFFFSRKPKAAWKADLQWAGSCSSPRLSCPRGDVNTAALAGPPGEWGNPKQLLLFNFFFFF